MIVTGCLGAEEGLIRDRFPDVAAITGAHAYDAVGAAVARLAPQPLDASPGGSMEPVAAASAVRLTPAHYAYLKISEGCDHACSFCIIPQLRGGLASRPVGEVLAEAERLVAEGVKEILVVSQDTSAYGKDLRYAPGVWRGREYARRPGGPVPRPRGTRRRARDLGAAALRLSLSAASTGSCR